MLNICFTLTFYATLNLLMSPMECHHQHRKQIVGGLPTSANEFNYVVHLELNGKPQCTGGIIDRSFILAAAHCVIETTNMFSLGRLTVVAGSKDLKVKDDPLRVLGHVAKAYVPASYKRAKNEVLFDSDIAILKLKQPLDLDVHKHLEVLNLPSDDHCASDDSRKNCVAKFAGFGWNKVRIQFSPKGRLQVKGSSDYELLKAYVKITSVADCLTVVPRQIHEKFFCGRVINYSDNRRQGVCTGDSGGPLVDDSNTVIGVLANGPPTCDTNDSPAAFTKVSVFMNFIRDAMAGRVDHTRYKTYRT